MRRREARDGRSTNSVLNTEARDPQPLDPGDVPFTRSPMSGSEEDLFRESHLSEEGGSFVEGLKRKEMSDGVSSTTFLLLPPPSTRE